VSRNIVIFSDGTGQRGGVFFDENRSNIYKLYRATRCGQDSTVNPSLQLTFYDPGIGTEPIGSSFLSRLYRRLHNLVSQATGLGLTLNMIQCYAAIIRLWRPGDKIFLFGFSRGAYTVRALGGVLSFCGVPTQQSDGGPLLRDEASTLKIAKEAVKQVYQFTNSRNPQTATKHQSERLQQRDLIAARFRSKYQSGDQSQSNAVPHFIGVFDTVASLASPVAIAGMIGAFAMSVGILAAVLSVFWLSFTAWSAIFLGLTAGIAAIWYLFDHIKMPGALPGFSFLKTIQWTEFRMRFYDWRLSPRVPYARHALSIDESRKDFNRVPWGTKADPNDVDEGGASRFQQVWFAGNHSDVGGSYAENDSRLSDTSLKWMVDAARAAGLLCDADWLNVFPDAAGPQHDERQGTVFRFIAPFVRTIPGDATLHQSVLDRFALQEVLQYNVLKPYRPDGLRQHEKVKQFYDPDP
jgi:uncharacterized protein (DUF2235 family)